MDPHTNLHCQRRSTLKVTQKPDLHPSHIPQAAPLSLTQYYTHTPSEQAKCNYGELLQLESLQSQLITISGTVHASTSTLD